MNVLVWITVLMIQGRLSEGWSKPDGEIKPFVATHEWQEIGKDQPIPAGLYVRINLQTGKREAKLLSDSDLTVGKELTLLPAASVENPKAEPEDERIAKALEQRYKEMRKNFKTDAELLVPFLNELRDFNVILTATDEETLIFERILGDLNDLVHQIDNAMLFVDKGGLDEVLLPIITNQTHVGLRINAIRVLGTVIQNNSPAQNKAFELNYGSYLSEILIESTNSEELAAAMYAFGSLLRNNPRAQQKILPADGMRAIIAVMSKECDLKVKTKAVTLISDMIDEQRMTLEEPAGGQNATRLALFKELHFEEWLLANDYCDTMDTLISGELTDFLQLPDIMEHFMRTLAVTRSYCMPQWSQSKLLLRTLVRVKDSYWQSRDEYRMDVSRQIDEMSTTMLLYDFKQCARRIFYSFTFFTSFILFILFVFCVSFFVSYRRRKAVANTSPKKV